MFQVISMHTTACFLSHIENTESKSSTDEMNQHLATFLLDHILRGMVERNSSTVDFTGLPAGIKVSNQWLWDASELLCLPSYALMGYGGAVCIRV